MPILEISVLPIGTGDTSIGSFITESCKSLKNKNISFEVTPTSTVIQGDLRQLVEIAEEMHAAPFKMGAQRVITSITIDERKDKNDDMKDKVEEVTENL